MSILRLTSANSLVVVIDLQERLLIRMPDMAGLLRDVGFLLDAANLLQLPIMTSEQYPQGLGPTHPEILRRVPKILAGKVSFNEVFSPTTVLPASFNMNFSTFIFYLVFPGGGINLYFGSIDAPGVPRWRFRTRKS